MHEHRIDFVRDVHIAFQGKDAMGTIKIGNVVKTQPDEPNAFWACTWSFSFIHPETGKIYGIDALDAFVNCLNFLMKLIHEHEQRGYEIWWHEKGDKGGLALLQDSREK